MAEQKHYRGGILSKIFKGLFKDRSPSEQPEGTYTFALNAIAENDAGEEFLLSNEESNFHCADIPGTIIGNVYMNNNRFALLSVDYDGGLEPISYIGIFYADTCTYEFHVEDSETISNNKLNFSELHQADITYRLRRGCEDIIYWTDNYNRPRQYNFNKPDRYKNQAGQFVKNKFDLQRKYSTIPEFKNLDVLDTGGTLLPGGYNISIQLVDDSLNPTEWITTSQVLHIYHDSISKDFPLIAGSINSADDYINFGESSKSIKIELQNLDLEFPYYRLAIIASNSGAGIVNEVFYTDLISTASPSFTYTGTNHLTRGSVEEVKMFDAIIEKADSIEQTENILYLANTSGPDAKFCALQRYASQIEADCITKEVALASLEDSANSKHPSQQFNSGLFYMPGEIYSFGIVYIFYDNTLSPVFHIPGKAPGDAFVIYDPTYDIAGLATTYPMSDNNEIDSLYKGNESCGVIDYWGKDNNGVPLEGKNVRHHRFPTRIDIGKPLLNKKRLAGVTISKYRLKFTLEGDIFTPVPCVTPGCGTDGFYVFNIKIDFKNNGQDYTTYRTVNQSSYADGTNNIRTVTIEGFTDYFDNNIFSDIQISVEQPDGTWVSSTDPGSLTVYFDSVSNAFMEEEVKTTTEQRFRESNEGFGIKFSNIIIPDEEEIGKKVIGYYIVRNERTEDESTILDTAVLTPIIKHNNYYASGLLAPQWKNADPNMVGIIYPKHKFREKEYHTFDAIIHQGHFTLGNGNELDQRVFSKVNTNDVFNGSSYNEEIHKKWKDDGNPFDYPDDSGPVDGEVNTIGYDGWSIEIIFRDNLLYFKNENASIHDIYKNNIEEIYYLDALEHAIIPDKVDYIYNIASDNKVGIIRTKKVSHGVSGKNFPFVLLYKENNNTYSNFRNLPYYFQNTRPQYFDGDNNSKIHLFEGDVQVTPMRYVNTIFHDNRVAARKLHNKRKILRIVGGVLIAIAAIVLGVVTAGAAVGLALPLAIGLGLVGAGGGTLLISSGIKAHNFEQAYYREYDKGLRQTMLDGWVKAHYEYRMDDIFMIHPTFGAQYTTIGEHNINIPNNQLWSVKEKIKGPSDDTIQWVADSYTTLWFESTVNINLRNRFKKNILPTFLPAPWNHEMGNDDRIAVTRFYGQNSGASSNHFLTEDSNYLRYPVSTLERHIYNKLLIPELKRNDGREYIGVALGEYYNVNLDYDRKNKEKVFFHLPLEYDCCSDCGEKFPHRIHASQQSFQEELNDNFRIFLPNNYTDIEGETGRITDLFRMGSNLYVHTEEALWMLPRNYQERVTDEIVSFIGTGEIFSIPPRKIVDVDNGHSAGSKHKWATIKTGGGILFISENQGKIALFNGEQINYISDLGMSNWFKNNIKIQADFEYKKEYNKPYPYINNPVSPLGTGYISTYDSRKNRVLVTKQDKIIDPEFIDKENVVCSFANSIIGFQDAQQIIYHMENDEGWTYIGIENCRLKFQKVVTTLVTVPGRVTTDRIEGITSGQTPVMVSMSHDIYGSPGEHNRNIFDNLITNMRDFVDAEYEVSMTSVTILNDKDWLEEANSVLLDPYYDGKDVVLILASTRSLGYHSQFLSDYIEEPTQKFLEDVDVFINQVLPRLNSFSGIITPVVVNKFAPNYGAGVAVDSSQNMSQILASVYGTEMQNHAVLLSHNAGLEPGDVSDIMTASGTYNWNPVALSDYGWSVYTGVSIDSIGQPPPHNGLQTGLVGHINDSVSGQIGTETQITVIPVDTIVTEYVDGEDITGEAVIADNSWTMSYSFKSQSWVSWHSYLPKTYLHTPNEFYSWEGGGIFQHNKLGHHQTFYNRFNPFIVEYVSLGQPTNTKIWDAAYLLTQAYIYDEDFEEFVESRFITFNKGMFYTSRQNTGVLNLIVKDSLEDENYLHTQVRDLGGDSIIVTKREIDWAVNHLRDNRIDHDAPMFSNNILDRQVDYYIDKVLDSSTIDYNKDWTQLESIRNKYLIIRLIFDNFDDVKLLLNYSVENTVESFR